MLSRIYLDNYGCFVNFEARLERRQLIYGGNGTGKTMLCRAIKAILFLVAGDASAEDAFPAVTRTRWLNSALQTFEIEATLDGHSYLYKLLIDRGGNPEVAQINEESVHCEGKTIFAFKGGEVRHFNDQFEETASFPHKQSRSAFLTVVPRPDNLLLTRFAQWLQTLWFFQIDPYQMTVEARAESPAPHYNLSNFSAWYRHLTQDDPRAIASYSDDLRESLDSFAGLKLKAFSQSSRSLLAEFLSADGNSVSVSFNELSEGQRCLIGLYALLHFAIARGQTVFLDEPDNFVALREIQPWLTKVEGALEEHGGQLVIVSHHPEILNQWLPDAGIRFTREGFGPVRVSPYRHPPDTPITPAEVVARGWDDA